jgi:uncharacterized coiled-coil DUF342 family protein
MQQHPQPQALYATSYRASYDSPFASPPPTVQKPAPLVLDPNNNNSNHHKDNYDNASSHSNSRTSLPRKLLEAVGMRSEMTVTSPSLVSFTSTTEPPPTTPKQQAPFTPSQIYQASYLARNAPQAGFLYKLGTHIPEFKRRFFVLKPTTHLYYFLSPNDPEPRGRVDLEGSQLEELEPLPDGRYRFAITWEHKQVILEARSKQVGQEWMETLKGERVSTLKEKVSELYIQSAQQQEQILELQKQVEHFRMVEKDRDGALEDARNYKRQVERLDEALRRLTQQVRRPPPTTTSSSEDNHDATPTINNKKENVTVVVPEKKDTIPQEDDSSDALLLVVPDGNSSSSNGDDGPNSSMLDMAADEEEGQEENWDTFQVPGTYFFALANACQQQRESLRLASIEANTAVEDLQACNGKLTVMSKRMEKAEKQIVKLWEENCNARKTLKQKKRERRVLVREVKALQEVVKEEKARPRKSPTKEQDVVDATTQSQPAMEDTMIGSDEERLIDELEEHIASSIRMHQRFLAGGGDAYEADLNTSMEGSEIVQTYPSSRITASGATLRYEYDASSSVSERGGRLSPLQPKLLSLFDDEASDRASDDEEDTDHYDDDEYQSVDPSVSSVGAEYGDGTDSIFSNGAPLEAIYSGDDNDSSPERPHPVLQLDQDEEEDGYYDKQPHLCAASTQSVSSKSVITDNGQATSRLVCPLADVRETSNIGGSLETNEDLQVYHLSFYTQKIGIQFQKAPPAPVRPRGLLTDAMTADLTGDKNGSGKTATELKNIAAISGLANSGQDEHGQDVCKIASPKDVVLVCGFQGFDDSGNNQRPNLGARLVAFDGISVEIGPWTFDSIRKAIKARGRPLTLSFRNDFLTSDQRAVLTKAVSEMEASAPPPRRTIQYRTQERPLSTTPSINSAISHESDNFVNDVDNRTTQSEETDLSAYASSAASSHCFAKRTLSSNSLSTHQSQYRRPSASTSVSTNQSNNFRSFSEAGTSSVISATFAPLMANLMKNVSARRGEEFTPDYLRRDQESLEHTPQHQDFQSNLL